MGMKFQCLYWSYGYEFSASIDDLMGMFSAFNVLMGYGYNFRKFLCLDSTLIMHALKKWHWNVGILLIVFTNKSVMHVSY